MRWETVKKFGHFVGESWFNLSLFRKVILEQVFVFKVPNAV